MEGEEREEEEREEEEEEEGNRKGRIRKGSQGALPGREGGRGGAGGGRGGGGRGGRGGGGRGGEGRGGVSGGSDAEKNSSCNDPRRGRAKPGPSPLHTHTHRESCSVRGERGGRGSVVSSLPATITPPPLRPAVQYPSPGGLKQPPQSSNVPLGGSQSDFSCSSEELGASFIEAGESEGCRESWDGCSSWASIGAVVSQASSIHL